MPNLRGKTWTTTTPANVEDAQYWEDHLISDTAAARAASSVQTVNSTAPDASGNVDIVALPSGGTAGQVLTKQSSTEGDADWEDPASSGHTIEDEDGNTMPYQSTLQFTNAEVTNDSVNSKTVVDCKGSKGDPGDAATVTVGTVTTLPAGSSATVTNSGTTSAAVFDFGIPKGADGTGSVDSVNGYTGTVVLDASDVGALPDSTVIPDPQIQSDWNQADNTKVDFIKNKPTIPAAQVNSDWNAASGVAQILNKPSIPTDLDDLSDVTVGSPSNGDVLTYNNGTFAPQPPSQGGHTMIDNSTYLASLTAKAADDTDDEVASGYAIGNWSNASITTIIAHVDKDDDTIGTWTNTWETDGVRTGWIWHKDLYGVVDDNEVEISIDFDVAGAEVVGLYAYRIDDNVQQTIDGQTVNGGAIAIKLTSPIQNASGVNVAVNLKRQRTNKVNATYIS